jgi:hypothetical protein
MRRRPGNDLIMALRLSGRTTLESELGEAPAVDAAETRR